MDSAPFDFNVPSPPRVYDALADGKDNFAADREAAARLLELNPDARAVVADNRAFLARAAGWAADRGVRQYIDLGAGFPRPGMPHEAVEGAQAVYVDSDTIVARHLHEELQGPGVAVVRADLRDIDAVLSAAVGAGMDLAEPVAVLAGLVLHFLPADEAGKAVDGYMTALAPGSVVAMSCWGTSNDELAERFTAEYPGELYRHPADVIEGWLDGLKVIEPGVTVPPPAIEPQRGCGSVRSGVAYSLIAVATKP